MKKKILLSCLLASAFILAAFTNKNESNPQTKQSEISLSNTYSVSVCKIFSPGRLDKDCSFVGEYDKENNYIKIYRTSYGVRSSNTPVAKGTPRRNDRDAWDSKDQRSNYYYCIDNSYFFNL